MNRLLAWLKKESHAEKLIANAIVDFAQGNQRAALGDLLQGILELAGGTQAEAAVFNLQTRLASYNLIPPVERPVAGPRPDKAA